MGYALVCAVAFGLFVLYDCNDALWKKPCLRPLFFIGCGLLLLDSAACLLRFPPLAPIWLLPGGLCLLEMVYALFFALPFAQTYVVQQEKPPVYDRGVYALCRHPGVLFYGLCWLFLSLAYENATVTGLGVWGTALNVGYVVFQDLWTFPRTFRNYPEYRKTTPFLLPTWKSMKRAWITRR